MGTSISQIEYWRGINNTDNTNNADDGGKGAIYLSYDVFLGLTVLGGFFALDHLYLRSPLTFVAKLITNFFTFGTWWLYDASQATFNRNVVKVFGLGVPGLGPKGIAAGVLASDIPDKKHMSFFVYALALLLGGIFGLDSFITGDKHTGFIRLFCLITGILAPVAILWWLYNTGLFLFKTKDVINKNWEYFGAPPPAEYSMSIGEKLVTKFPILQPLLGPARAVKSAITTATQIAENVFEDPIGVATSTVQTAAKPVINAATTAATIAAAPIIPTIDTGLEVAKQGLNTIHDGLALGKSALNAGSLIADKTLNVVDKTATAAAAALALAPQAAALGRGFTPDAAKQALNILQQTEGSLRQTGGSLRQTGGSLRQTGGSGYHDDSILPYMVLGTLALIAASSIFLSYRRLRQNGQPRKDDAPPEPGVFRESNKKESRNTA